MLLMLAFAGCGSPDPQVHRVVPAQDEAAMHVFDIEYLDLMIPHHQGALDMAMIARTRGEHAEIRALADTIIKSQTAEIGTMQGWRAEWIGAGAPPHALNLPGDRGDGHLRGVVDDRLAV